MNQPANQFIFVTPPDRIRAAGAYGMPLAHMAYRIGNGPHLYRAKASAVPRGGLMVIGEDTFDGKGDLQNFCREVVRECNARGFGGVVLDLDSPPTPALAKIIGLLSDQCSQRSWSFYLPEPYSNYSNSARILLSSAISGGTLQQRLSDAVDRYGADRVVLCLDRSAEDFYLPAPTGSGKPLSRDELKQRMQALSPSVFFSNELCAHYFTYMSRDSGAHFVLFDDVGSLQQKIKLAEQLGIHRFLLFYSQLDDLLPELFPSTKRT